MLRHNLLLFYRNLKRFRNAFLINLVGLATGLACFLLIYLWVEDELSVDKFHEKDGQLYQVMENQENSEGIRTVEWTPAPLADALKAEIPEVAYAVTTMPSTWFPPFTLTIDEHTTTHNAVGQFAGNDFFNLFSLNLIQGDREQVLRDKNAIVISEDLALRLFKTTQNIVGKTLEWQLWQFKAPCTVSGIYEGIPPHSTMQGDFVLSFDAFKAFQPRFEENWEASAPSTFIVLKENTDISDLNTKIAEFVKSKLENSNVSLFIRKYSDQYLYGNYENGIQKGGRIIYVRLFSIIGIFILLIACINFMNLSTAQASRKFKEVGVKKSIGASRKTLILQYLSESVIITFTALLIALLTVVIVLPQFNSLTGKNLTLAYDLNNILINLGATFITGLIAGSYPALYLSGFKPVNILKGQLPRTVGERWARNGLVVFQFALSIIFIVGVFVIYSQITFVQTKNLGYNKDNIISFQPMGATADRQETVIAELKDIPGVTNASSTSHTFTGTYATTSSLGWPGKAPKDKFSFEYAEVNYGLIGMLGIELKSGRDFSRNFGNEESKIIFNEAAIEAMGLQDPVGKVIDLWGQQREIIGVVKDFHFESLHENIKPLFFTLDPTMATTVIAKIQAGREQEAIAHIQHLCESFDSGVTFEYRFLDEQYQKLYVAEQRVSLLSRYFAGLTVLISCLGLFGLAVFTAERKTKEIGVRKVLGATAWKIIQLLAGDFVKPVLLAIVVALPISFFLTKNWLDSFAYRIDLAWVYFIGAGAVVMAIAMLTVSWQAIRAAAANPVDSLRDE